ncbi:MAG TPA: cyclase family protein [Longimicrobiales bacterium]|nr:cyclase family protein [Longimicrobiales bacterium]
MARIHDISQPIGARTAVYPGDPAYRQSWALSRERGDPVDVAEITIGVHIGTHVDGPGHVLEDATPVGELHLEPFLGPAHVVDAVERGTLAPDLVDGLDLVRAPRVLFRTRRRVDPTTFPHGYVGIAPALAERLVASGVRLVGTDAPSVDAEDAGGLPAHRILLAGGVAIAENLVLDDVRPGVYTLVALPLKLVEADSSPVRAVLVEDE